MKYLVPACAAVLSAGVLVATMSVAFAQNSPGVPGGILSDGFKINEHPQMPFGASAPSKKYQSDKPGKLRKRGDNGDPDGCNLKCPDDQ
ncbi:hypothetical protein [Paraburkholderia sp. C35]|jgi:hypothetical protein|uniref:hypothetical protein n=1 Tax=Paraburkholderia sp. C35 TaxID=2126993 RepID=UPI000D69C85A|nr:hypothetical protein [Paraburkholderia sp. C35]